MLIPCTKRCSCTDITNTPVLDSYIFSSDPSTRPETVKPYLESIVKLQESWYDIMRKQVTSTILIAKHVLPHSSEFK